MPKVKVWCDVMIYRVIAFFFLSEKTINGINCYLKTIISYYFPFLVELKNNEQTNFQKDIARPHLCILLQTLSMKSLDITGKDLQGVQFVHIRHSLTFYCGGI